jgi:very-short-patch-repair endonuclease
MDVVHSLRAVDIRSQQEGPRLLRRYLEYVVDPLRAFESEATIDDTAETESPFEEAVERALVGKGYKVARQVGVSWYRIDLAILSEDGNIPELGIECDGAQYHSSPAARDRDWLRQQVLEGLGWNIHRVWSTAWIRNPAAELARIETALTKARLYQESTPNIVPTPSAQPRGPLDDLEEVVIETPEPEELELEDYQKAELSPVATELRYESTEVLIDMIDEIARREGLVHKDVVIDRIRECYGMGHVRGSTRIR